MNAWLNDPATASIPHQDNGAFNPQTIDPSMAFVQHSPNPGDSGQFQRMFNGVGRTMSPGFQTPGSVIPSKRPRPEDGIAMSPRPAPGHPGSRSQTPQQVPYPGYQGPANGASQFTPSHVPASFQHLQNVSANASPSPILQDFDPQTTQRVQTASPSPFSPAGMHVGAPQMSPTHPDHSVRVNTPQNNAFIPGQPYPQPMAPQFSPSPGMTSGGMPPGMQAQYPGQANPTVMQAYNQQQQLTAQQRMYHMQLQNHNRQLQAGHPNMVGRAVPGQMNPMANPQVTAMRNMQQNMAKPTSPEQFLRGLQKFMMTRGLPLESNPVVGGRPISLVQLYGTVMKLGGSKKTTASNGWAMVAQQLQFPAMQYPMAAQELHDVYLRNLAAYEQAWLSTQQKQAIDHAQQQRSPQRPTHPNDPMGVPPQASPTKPMNHHPSYDLSQQFPHPSPSGIPPQHQSQTSVNGFATQQQIKSQQKQQSLKQQQIQQQQRSGLSRPPDSAPPNGEISQFPSSPHEAEKPAMAKTQAGASDAPLQHVIDDTYKPIVLPESRLHGPVVVDEVFQLGNDLIALKPNAPSFVELGVIDFHALSMSIQSGLHAEMRVALDTLTQLSSEAAVQISLDNCDDLVEILIDCAEDQLEFLAENAAEVSDVIVLPSYEENLRGCRQEMESLLDVPEFGSLDYELDRAADRLICITTILRNFSFAETNLNILSRSVVVKFVSAVIRYLGTRNVLLRNHQNTLDFMKDAVTYLSNLGHAIELPGREEALSLLHLLLSFAPTPCPTSFKPDRILFVPFDPTVHRYLPAAVDGLAKLLARDDPNRIFYRDIFAQDHLSSPPGDLLTRAFGLVIAPMPEHYRANPVALAEVRRPFLMQGTLAADILAGFADNHTARSWLESTDGFATSFLRMACLLSADRTTQGPMRHGQPTRVYEPEYYGYTSIANRALSSLCRLAGKSKRVDGKPWVPFSVLPKKENLLGALLSPNIDPNIVRQLCEYTALG